MQLRQGITPGQRRRHGPRLKTLAGASVPLRVVMRAAFGSFSPINGFATFGAPPLLPAGLQSDGEARAGLQEVGRFQGIVEGVARFPARAIPFRRSPVRRAEGPVVHVLEKERTLPPPRAAPAAGRQTIPRLSPPPRRAILPCPGRWAAQLSDATKWLPPGRPIRRHHGTGNHAPAANVTMRQARALLREAVRMPRGNFPAEPAGAALTHLIGREDAEIRRGRGGGLPDGGGGQPQPKKKALNNH